MANEHSQIVPSMQPTAKVADFKFWCQKVLPLVYDDSLSYYEVLNKMVVYLNQVIDNINADTANVAELEDDFLLLQTYVNNFFDDIDQLATYAERAEAAQTAAAASALNAASSASNSASSASNSASSAISAATSALSALDAKDAAVIAKTAAETALASAQTAATNAANSATSAGNSATAASGSATNASASATAAQQSFTLADAARTAAQTAASNAADSAAAAAASSAEIKAAITNTNTAIDILDGDVAIELTEFSDSLSSSGVTAEYSNGKIKLYGTSTATRFLLCLNGQHKIKSGSQGFEQTVDSGLYKVQLSASGYISSDDIPNIRYTTTNFNDSTSALNNEWLIFNTGMMVAFVIKNNTNYGTADSPTYIELSLRYYEEKAPKQETETNINNILNKNTEIQLLLTAADFENGGISESGTNLSRPKRIRTKGYISCSAYKKIRFSAASGYKITITFYSDNGTYVARADYIEGEGAFPIPKTATYLRLQYESTDEDATLATSDYSNVSIYLDYALNTVKNSIGSQTKWLAIGDSITVGKCSDSNAARGGYGWVRILGESFGYSYYNSGVNGMGYVTSGDNGIKLSDQLTTLEALTEDFNLITIMLGINDYNSSAATVENIQASLASAIERLMAKFPNARLVVFTPLNACNRGTASDCFDYGYPHGGRKLKDIADGIVATCDSYGVESHMISNGFVFNSQNIEGLIPDKVHPSQLGQMLIAKAIARYLIN